jgi:hypothetical protein
MREIGFRYVAVDLEGYVMGSLNRALGGKGTRVQGVEGSSENNLQKEH